MPEHVYAVMEYGQSYELVSPPVRWSQSAPAPHVPIPYAAAQRFLATEKWHIRDPRDGAIKETQPRFKFYARYEDIPLSKRNPARAQALPVLRLEGGEVGGMEGLALEAPTPPETATPETEAPAGAEPSAPSVDATPPADARTRAQRVRDQMRKNAEANGTAATPAEAPSAPRG